MHIRPGTESTSHSQKISRSPIFIFSSFLPPPHMKQTPVHCIVMVEENGLEKAQKTPRVYSMAHATQCLVECGQCHW